jgi:hypothetical protein
MKKGGRWYPEGAPYDSILNPGYWLLDSIKV